MVVASDVITRAIRNKIFQTMDSSPVIQGRALAGAFNATPRRNKEYKNYFDPIIKEYKYRLELLKTMINGLDSISDTNLRAQLEQDIRRYAYDYKINQILEGINGVDFVTGTNPDLPISLYLIIRRLICLIDKFSLIEACFFFILPSLTNLIVSYFNSSFIFNNTFLIIPPLWISITFLRHFPGIIIKKLSRNNHKKITKIRKILYFILQI